VVETRKFLGRRMESTMEVTEHEPPHRFTVRVGSGPVPFTARNTLSEADGSTRVTTLVEGEPGGFFRLAEPLVARALEREVRNNLATLKDVLEQRG
jgi:carbon monoxide dehydrogenase subunit G